MCDSGSSKPAPIYLDAALARRAAAMGWRAKAARVCGRLYDGVSSLTWRGPLVRWSLHHGSPLHPIAPRSCSIFFMTVWPILVELNVGHAHWLYTRQEACCGKRGWPVGITTRAVNVARQFPAPASSAAGRRCSCRGAWQRCRWPAPHCPREWGGVGDMQGGMGEGQRAGRGTKSAARSNGQQGRPSSPRQSHLGALDNGSRVVANALCLLHHKAKNEDGPLFHAFCHEKLQ